MHSFRPLTMVMMFDTPNISIMLGATSSPPLNMTYISDLAARLGSVQIPSVVLLTSRYDLDADLLQVYLNAEGYASIRLNCESFPSEFLSHLYGDGAVTSTLRDEAGRSYPFEPKVVVYRHFHHFSQICNRENGETLLEASQRRQMAENLEEHFCHARWINHPHAVRRCRNRLLQLQLANRSGLVTPNTLITNDRTEAESFVRANDSVIAKAIDHHGVRGDNTLHNFYGRLITGPTEAGFINRDNPVLLQKYSPKIAEIRAYAIDKTVVAVRIEAKASTKLPVDIHMMPLESYGYSLCELPPAILRGCLELTAALQLTYAAIDFIQLEDQTLVFLEVNPGGDWAWIDSQVESGLTTIFAKVVANHAQ
jgi:glutathione synthase/RimK-type ligase-like ATP-grasp enzyme